MSVPAPHVYNIVKQASAESTGSALDDLMEACRVQTGASTGRLYKLDLAKAAFVLHGAHDQRAGADMLVSLRGGRDGTEDSALRKAIHECVTVRLDALAQQPLGRVGPEPARSRLIVPIVRNRVPLAIIDLDSDRQDHFTSEHEEVVSVAALIALLVAEKEDVVNLLKVLQAPVDYQQPWEQFLDEMMLMVAAASRMPIVVLRELTEESLYCLKQYGLDRTADDLHLSPVSDYEVFEKVVQERHLIALGPKDISHAEHLRKLDLKAVRSAIILPVLVGQDVFGTLSFATLCTHDYTPLQQQALQAVANAVGIAIANHRNFHNAQSRLFERATIGAAITTVDIAQSVRHEARNHLQDAQEALGLLHKSDVIPTKAQEEVNRRVSEISEQLRSVDIALQKIKTITKPPERQKKAQRLDDLWREAFGLALGRLEHLGIDWQVSGAGIVNVAPDYIRTAFLNLILNSIDAFKSAKKKGRTIRITIGAADEKARDVLVRYVDNATGIDASKLASPHIEGGCSVGDIFLPGVTSKADGSGYGLYLVRKIISEHHGSIDLIDHRNGVVFEMKLPRHG